MEQKIAFIREWESGQDYFNSLCEVYGVSRKTGYNIIKRYKQKGLYDLAGRPQESNDIWSADYKGDFLLGNKKRCYPLTVCDSCLRFIFKIRGATVKAQRM